RRFARVEGLGEPVASLELLEIVEPARPGGDAQARSSEHGGFGGHGLAVADQEARVGEGVVQQLGGRTEEEVLKLAGHGRLARDEHPAETRKSLHDLGPRRSWQTGFSTVVT